MAQTPAAPRLKTPIGRVIFHSAFKARPSGEDGTGALKYSITLVFDPTRFTPAEKVAMKKLEAALNEESMRAFKKPWSPDMKGLKPGIRRLEDRAEPFTGVGIPTKGYFVNLSSDFRPGVADLNGVDISPEDGNEDLLFRGCYARATVNPYNFTQKTNKGVGLGLNNIQVIKSGPRLDNRKSAAEDFADDEVDEEWLKSEMDEEEVDNSSSDDEDY